MAEFKIPTFRNRNQVRIQGVPEFDCGQLQIKERIGQGSFGEVYSTVYKTETVVIKKAIQALDAEDRKLYIAPVTLLFKKKY